LNLAKIATMKLNQLQALVLRLSTFDFIRQARRIEDNTIELIFDKDNSYFFNMTRAHSFVYKAKSQKPLQNYQAPFDNQLQANVAYSKILSVTLHQGDRIIALSLAPKSSYKDKVMRLYFEFTGKNTNVILVDENEVILEALRHVDASKSFRVVRPGVELLSVPPYEGNGAGQVSIEDIDALLDENYHRYEATKIASQRKQKLASIEKKITTLQKKLHELPNGEELLEESRLYGNYGNIILANLHAINQYDTHLATHDFEGNEVSISLPHGIAKGRFSEYYFNLAKRAKSKAKNVHIESENLQSKLTFYQNLSFALTQAKDGHELELLVPKRAKMQRKKEKLRECELFWVEGYKVLVGRNSIENQKLLAAAKANDIWMHIRDIPSSHVIIRTDKQNIPQSLIESAAKLCVDFSTTKAGGYEVDYTKRKFVKIQEGSNVLYNKYETVRVTKEGIEIRV